MRAVNRLGWLAVVCSAAALLATARPGFAQGGGDDKAFEKSVDASLRDVINRGAGLFNNHGDYAGCYRLFEGSLMTLRPLLSKYPDLQAYIDKGMAEANSSARIDERAHGLRKVLDEIRYTFSPNLRPAPKTLWDRLGGEKGVEKVVAQLIEVAAADPKVNFDRGGKYAFTKPQIRLLQKALVDFVSAATGGPFKYTGLSMKAAHKGMAISDEEFDALAGHLKAVLESNNVKTEDVKAVMDAVGGTRKDIVEAEKKKDEPAVKKETDKKNDDMKEVKKGVQADPNMAQIDGRVMLMGVPLNHGFVTFVNAAGKSYSANILKDGAFSFKVGIPPGDYAIAIEVTTTPPAAGEVRAPIPASFQQAGTSGLRFTPKKGANGFNIELK